MKKNQKNMILVLGLVLVLIAAVLQARPWQRFGDAETRAWRLVMVDVGGNERELRYKDITKMPAFEGNGGFFSTVGIVYGPVDVKGVRLSELCDVIGGVNPDEAVMISAHDGYSTVLSYEQVMGDFVGYTTDLKEVAGLDLNTVLIYNVDKKPLDHEAGKPVRLAVVGTEDGYLTEGNYWVKWVERIEILKIR